MRIALCMCLWVAAAVAPAQAAPQLCMFPLQDGHRSPCDHAAILGRRLHDAGDTPSDEAPAAEEEPDEEAEEVEEAPGGGEEATAAEEAPVAEEVTPQGTLFSPTNRPPEAFGQFPDLPGPAVDTPAPATPTAPTAAAPGSPVGAGTGGNGGAGDARSAFGDYEDDVSLSLIHI